MKINQDCRDAYDDGPVESRKSKENVHSYNKSSWVRN